MPTGHGAITYPRFQAALDNGDLAFIRRHAAELAPIRLADALEVCLLVRDQDPARLDRAIVRWVGRFALEAPAASIADVRDAADALAALREDSEGAMEVLSELCIRHRLAMV